MKKLIFKQLWILSKAQKTATHLQFSPTANLFLSKDNNVGKSTVLKCLYHTLGADVPGLKNTKWSNAKAIYAIEIHDGQNSYVIIRDEKFFGVFDSSKKLLSKHHGISGSDGIHKFINNILGFKIELKDKNDKIRPVGPAYYFLPFYIDQDDGWTSTWSSFANLTQFKEYRRLLIEYHLSVRGDDFYKALKDKAIAQEEIQQFEFSKGSLTYALKKMQERSLTLPVEIDRTALEDEIEEAVTEYNRILTMQQDWLAKVKDTRNRRNHLLSEIETLKATIKELEADYKFVNQEEHSEQIECPTCSTSFVNSFADKFGYLDDISYCHSLLDDWQKRLRFISTELDDADDKYSGKTRELDQLAALLNRKKGSVSVNEVISARGLRESIQSLKDEIDKIHKEIDHRTERVASLNKSMKIDSDQKEEILNHYMICMKENLHKLQVHTVSKEKYNELNKQIKVDAQGSDLSRSLLAQYFSLLHTKVKFSNSFICPMVIDSPFQQEQSDENSEAIFEFICTHIIKGQQLFLATTHQLSDKEINLLPDNKSVFKLTNQFGLLSGDNYETVIGEIGHLHTQMLTVG